MRDGAPELDRRAALQGLACLLAVGCEEPDLADLGGTKAPPVAQPAPNQSARAARLAEEVARRERKREALAADAVRRIREQTLSVVALSETMKHLAFGKRFLIQARASALLRFDSETGRELARFELGPAQAVFGLPHGNVLALTAGPSIRFEPAPAQHVSARHIALWPGSRLERVPNAPDRVFLVDGVRGTVERRQLFSDKFIALDENRALPDYRGGPLTTLRDGSLLYLAPHGAYRGFALGAKRQLTLHPSNQPGWGAEVLSKVFRVRPAETADRVWALDAQGTFWLLDVRSGLRVIRRFFTERAPFEFVATPQRLVMISVAEGQGPRRFRLHVFDPLGRELFTHDLGTREAGDEQDWVANLVADFELAVAEDIPRVAVGSRDGVQLWALDSGRPIGAEDSD